MELCRGEFGRASLASFHAALGKINCRLASLVALRLRGY